MDCLCRAMFYLFAVVCFHIHSGGCVQLSESIRHHDVQSIFDKFEKLQTIINAQKAWSHSKSNYAVTTRNDSVFIDKTSENILNRKLFDIFFRKVASDRIGMLSDTDNQYIIVSPCQALLQMMAEVAANLTSCVVKHAYPEDVCFGCFYDYLNFKQAFSLMHDDGFRFDADGVMVTCDEYFSGAEIQYVQLLYTFMTESVWEKSNCDSCLESSTENGTITVKPNKQTEVVLNYFDDFLVCLADNHYFPPLNLGNVSLPKPNASICENCYDAYASVTTSFESEVNKNFKFCEDVKALVNESIAVWQQLDCKNAEITLDPATIGSVCICFFVLFMTVIFYVGSYVQGTRKIRRMRRYRAMSHVGRISRRFLTSIGIEPTESTHLLRSHNRNENRPFVNGHGPVHDNPDDDASRLERARAATLG